MSCIFLEGVPVVEPFAIGKVEEADYLVVHT